MTNLLLIEDNGDETLYLDTNTDQYVFTTDDGTLLRVTHPIHGDVGPDTFSHEAVGPWELTQIAANDQGGYNGLLVSATGITSLWSLDATGAYVSHTVYDDISPLEGLFEADLNGDGNALTLIEDNGDETLYLDTNTDQYVFTTDDGTLLRVTHPIHGDVGPDTFSHEAVGPWELTQIAANDQGGYNGLLVSATGITSLWSLGATGAYVSHTVYDDISPLEGLFEADLNGDSIIFG
ncbi:hypothetical protein GFB49_18550 [Epibacterium sp. SM1979]|uniref:Uncharacterized protein n=1 Tax=Tritonibacter litoralis TaxID=2662264 RepID=A0A843YKX3_9RHOB|nr:hypothetical protein [Tritonibacter litoralis]MQQ10468.1 hypothetical protein [Tritonibacter litoralis]